MRIGFFCYGERGGDFVECLSRNAKGVGHRVVLWPKQAIDQAVAGWLTIRTLDVMVLCFSNFGIEEEIAFVEKCYRSGVPWVVVEDMSGVCLRTKLERYASQSAAAVLANPITIDVALGFGYRKVVYLGPPEKLETRSHIVGFLAENFGSN